jgi:hypothetical protein
MRPLPWRASERRGEPPPLRAEFVGDNGGLVCLIASWLAAIDLLQPQHVRIESSGR